MADTSVVDSSRMENIEQYLPLVEQVVVQTAVHFPRHVDRGELVRAGVLGLVEAAHRFDGERGVPFERFAAQRIRGAVLDAVRAADWAPRSVRAMSRRVDSTEQSLANTLARTPTTDEVAEALGTTPNEIKSFRDRVFRSVVLALDQKVSGDTEDMTLVDSLHDRTTLEPSEELEFLGVTESRVSQLRSEALVMLKEGIEAQYDPADDELDTPMVSGRMARRKAGYAAAVGTKSDWRDRLDKQRSA
jgi:RNA polymerase sigma factor FliA